MSGQPRNSNTYFALFGQEVGIKLDIPHHARLLVNFGNQKARLSIDKEALILQHLTIGFKIGAAIQSLNRMEKSADFFEVGLPDAKAKVEGRLDQKKLIDFQYFLESFFSFAWGVITSVARELFIVYKLKIKAEEIYFYSVKACFKKDSPNTDITKYLETISNAEWFNYLHKARNRMEHGQIPMYQYRVDGSVVLADDQSLEHRMFTTTKNLEPMKICNEILNETRKFEEYCSSEINRLLYE